jgi:putative MFS transporter
MQNTSVTKNILNISVIVAALGYFVDIYDLILFGIVRVPSLHSLGCNTKEMTDLIGTRLLNFQMSGMLIGGIIWGVLGDKKGRLSALFLTILLYSLANIANGMITTINQYYVLRFLAGLGLAGELGIGITLVSEVMTKESRGYGTTIVAGVGIAGAVVGNLVADYFNWRVAYYVGGVLGLALLAMRISLFESGMFERTKDTLDVQRGNFLKLFTQKERFFRYIKTILVGLPVWYVIGIIVFFSNKFADALHVHGEVKVGKAVMYHYMGASIGAFATGLLSQYLKSRKKALLTALIGLVITIPVLFLMDGISSGMFYFMLFIIGIPNGYWSVFVTNAAEEFGTNMRATVTTTAPNFVRGATVLLTLSFSYLSADNTHTIRASVIIGIVVIAIAIYACITMNETYHKDLDYIEEH